MTLTHTKTLLGILIVALALSWTTVYADDGNEGSTEVDVRARAEVRFNGPDFEARRQEAGERRDAARKAAEEKRQEVRDNIDAKRADVRANIDTRRTDVQANIDTRRAEIRANIELRRTEFQENSEERREMREDRREEIRAKISERLEARAQLHLDRFTRILDAAIERLYGLVDRVTDRADEMDAEGKDTSVAREHLDLAVSELVAAETALASIEADLEATLSLDIGELTRDSLRAAFSTTKAAIEEAKQHVRAAHQAIRDAIEALKVSASASVEAEAGTEVE